MCEDDAYRSVIVVAHPETRMLPTLFISHGSPMLALTDVPARHFLAGLGSELPRPRAVLVVSAHWETAAPEVNAVAVNDTIHDFTGFPAALYAIRYPAPGSPELAERIVGLLAEAGLPARVDHARGLDHGSWVPLSLVYPAHDIPVLQLSVQSHLGAAYHWQVGRALAGLRAEGVLVIGSGSFTHDLRRFRGQPVDAPEAPDVTAFADWFDAALTEGRTADLLAYRRLAPYAVQEHPTEEHLLPLFVAMGAAGEDAAAQRLHASANYGILRMDAYAFGAAPQ
jgi:4,5-DOPA dioxygenase extradiol